MRRRDFLLGLGALACAPMARAGALDSISGAEAAQALRDSLSQGVSSALSQLGRENGYFANPQVRIDLPNNFSKAERVLRALGHGRQVDDLVLAMNRAAEMALPRAEDQIVEAVKHMSMQDAKGILTGGDQAMTDYFRKATEAQLFEQLGPAISGVAGQSGLTRAYNALSETLVSLAGIRSKQAKVEDYVNRKALDGIYQTIGAGERALRANPSRYAGGLIGKVFGLIQ